ncbi:MAG: tetratricopeptide repeat protein [Candidatus Izemoplasmatales bacterium]
MERDPILTEAIKAYEVRQYDKALSLLRRLARKNDPEALYYLGMIHYENHAGKPDPVFAFDCFRRSAMELEVRSLYMCGRCYEEGSGVEKDLAKAYEYYAAGSAKGDPEAALKEAECLETGKGIARNEQKALAIYVELSKRQNPYATYRIGMAYLEGRGVARSPESAFSWLNKALALGSADAMNQFRLIGTKSKTDARSTADIAQIGRELFRSDRPERAIPYLLIAAAENDAASVRLLQEAAESGRGMKQDAKVAFEYAQRGAAMLDPVSMLSLGRKYEAGDGVRSSALSAASWYAKAAQAGSAEAAAELVALRGY